ncbi:benzoylformate decarboxylase [Actinomadura graeca]|uniref:Benzoylformate decarboxylase n=1 Tax=Actinomadura graeca TaxID=2750812 RepID=A0ABX8QXH0_9ACTN|nr:benzoylformate decarboxylase [Actinomadura graeca]QXJ23432.1 benzoylformate decarboxylase [Actinomadura graeca]
MSATVRDAVRGVLAAHGVTRIFGNPGSTELRFFRDWPDGLDYVMVPQEAAALAMADGHAQASGTVGVVMVHSAAGLGHALGSLFTAERNGTPMVVIAGQQSRSLLTGDPYLHARRATEFPRPYVKFAAEAARPRDVPEVVAQAFRYAAQPPSGPVFVSVPEDDWDAPADHVPHRQVSTSLAPAPGDVAKVAHAMAQAGGAALVLGAKVAADGARDQAVVLAERLGVPVFTAPLASRSPFPEDHPQFAGFLPPVSDRLHRRLADHDLVLVIGAPVFTYHIASSGPPADDVTRLIQVVDDPRQAALAHSGDSLLASAGAFVDALLSRLPAVTERPLPAPAKTPASRPGALTPEDVMRIIDSASPPDAVIVEEAPTHRNAMHEGLPITAGRDFFVAASGGLGWAMPAAVGIAMARPARRIVCLIGDGSSLYSPQALWTAAQHGTDVTFVVLDNGGYAAMKAFGTLLGVTDAPGLELPGIDFPHLATAFGVPATSVANPSELAKEVADPTLGPRLVHVPMTPAARALS